MNTDFSNQEDGKGDADRPRRPTPEHRPKGLVDLDKIVAESDLPDKPSANRRLSLDEIGEQDRSEAQRRESDAKRQRLLQAAKWVGTVAALALVIVLIAPWVRSDPYQGKRERVTRELAAIEAALKAVDAGALLRSCETADEAAEGLERQLKDLARLEGSTCLLQPSEGVSVAIRSGESYVIVPRLAGGAEGDLEIVPELRPADKPVGRLRWDDTRRSLVVSDAESSRYPVRVGGKRLTRSSRSKSLRVGARLQAGRNTWKVLGGVGSLPEGFPVFLRDPWNRHYQLHVASSRGKWDRRAAWFRLEIRSRGPSADDSADDLTKEIRVK